MVCEQALTQLGAGCSSLHITNVRRLALAHVGSVARLAFAAALCLRNEREITRKSEKEIQKVTVYRGKAHLND